ncbi:hypothetical protein HETIRDRAFT_450931 [Heterobasidion irregulare TC 32-1]|uniref:Uncharacterized protein n=1 Tax=Heterobasidion irregulare (strain TC 32-1) TaxID=747525 RepID=W4KC36_HETIT|nr:uncharacterized protein HETIRDRAFT_450931 [Heterobasidion irregulare TC 32-1]ETW83328.1 hypothetical protein HETIRDRAFT_450931 [Heterobasidion irregulare TC 32-1]
MLPLLRRNCIPSPPAHHHHSSASVPATPEQSPHVRALVSYNERLPRPFLLPGIHVGDHPRRRNAARAGTNLGQNPWASNETASAGARPIRPAVALHPPIGHQSGGAPRLTQAPSPEDGMRPCAASLKRSSDFARAYACPLPFLPAFAFSYLASQSSRDEARTELQGIGKACRMEAPAVGEPGLSHESREAGLASWGSSVYRAAHKRPS